VPGEDPAIDSVRASPPDRSGALSLRFRYRCGGRACDVAVDLSPAAAQPRRAVLEIDGRTARRVVEPGSYRLSFAAPDERRVPLGDPLTRLVAAFVAALRAPEAEAVRRSRHVRAREIAQRMELLGALVRATPHEHEEGP